MYFFWSQRMHEFTYMYVTMRSGIAVHYRHMPIPLYMVVYNVMHLDERSIYLSLTQIIDFQQQTIPTKPVGE